MSRWLFIARTTGALGLALFLAAPARGDSILVQTGYATSGGLAANSIQAIAQPFTLSDAALLSHLQVYAATDASNTLTVWLMSNIGADAGSGDVLASAVFQGSPNSLPGAYYALNYDLPVNLAVPAGEYYVVLASNSGENVWWFFGTPQVGSASQTDLIASASGYDPGFPPDSYFYNYSSPVTLTVWGTALPADDPPPAHAPEPGTLALVLSGGLLAAWRHRRRRV